jgi:hypothetical protein
MATVSSLVRQAKDSYMNFIDYTSTYRDDNKEFLRGDMWEFSFINPPKIVYYPGDTIFKARLNQINLGIDTSVNGFEKRMRGNYVIIQKTGQQTSGQISLQFTDKEDQAISYFVDDWKQKIADRDTKYSFRKDDLVADAKLVITNSSRIAVRTLTFYNCIIQDAGLDENGTAEDGSDRAEVPLTLQFEHFERNFDNLA